MAGRNSFEDELARRRRLRERQSVAQQEEAADSTAPAQAAAPEDEELPNFGWKDILAMCIAAYQIIFPILLLLVAVMAVAFLLFKWFFH